VCSTIRVAAVPAGLISAAQKLHGKTDSLRKPDLLISKFRHQLRKQIVTYGGSRCHSIL
jgi:hypothetical protein